MSESARHKGNGLRLHTDLPPIAIEHFQAPNVQRLHPHGLSTHALCILLLGGSLGERSFNRLLVEKSVCLLQATGAETRVFNPNCLPLPDDAPDTHPKVVELRELAAWADGMVWCSPQRHSAMPSAS